MKYRFYVQYEGLVVEWDSMDEFDSLREMLQFKRRLYRPVDWGILKEWDNGHEWDYISLKTH